MGAPVRVEGDAGSHCERPCLNQIPGIPGEIFPDSYSVIRPQVRFLSVGKERPGRNGRVWVGGWGGNLTPPDL